MRNQPKYNFFKNTSYALDGLIDIVKNEKSFKIELVLFAILTPIIWFLFPYSFLRLLRISPMD